MFETFIVTLREGVEAALVIAIAVAWLKRSGRPELLPTVYHALVAAVIACFIGAWGMTRIGLGGEAFEGWTLLASAAFVISMVIWMNRHGRKMKGEIETRLQKDAVAGRGRAAVFTFVFLMIFREGVETVLLLTALRLDTAGLLEGFGAVLGIGLAVLFGVSFVRGTIRVNLRQFFQITTVILMVVAAQLVLTGLHELSEGEILPSSSTEMAILGPIVKNEIFFFVTIFALAAAMILFEWRGRRTPAAQGLEGAALRKAQWNARRERLWMIASCTASCLFILLVTAEYVYAREATELSPATDVAFENGAIHIPVSSVSDGSLHRFLIDDQGVHVRFIVIQRPDASLAVALDACAICGTQGYYQKNGQVICRNCSSNILTSSIGSPGGCNPIPLESHVEGATLVIDSHAFDFGVKVFAKG